MIIYKYMMKKKQQNDLFDYKLRQDIISNAPLATRMRPQKLEDFIGQENILSSGSVLWKAIKEDKISSMIFWGPPGTGKTTLARIISRESKSQFFPISAVSSGVAELREIIKKSREIRSLYGTRAILFIDEIHRFNKAQQDAVLPFVENGLIILIGATTENPSFEVNSALLSRSRVYVFNRLTSSDINILLQRALKDQEKGLGKYNVKFDEDAWDFLILSSQGDARVALNTLEIAVKMYNSDSENMNSINIKHIEETLQHRATLYDKKGEQHYDLISALHKSMRNSDPDASLYWLGRMIEGGEDPLFIARRIIRFASEDIGLADPGAIVQAVSAYQVVHFIGLPECDVALAQAVVYMSCARKSNSLYTAIKSVKEDIASKQQLPVPLHLRNAVTDLMKGIGYGSGYKYAHDFPDKYADMDCLPENLRGKRYFFPSDYGWESEIAGRIASLKKDKTD